VSAVRSGTGPMSPLLGAVGHVLRAKGINLCH